MSIERAFDEHERVVSESRALVPKVREMAEIVRRCLGSGGKLLVCGNGGSAADAQHFAAEFIGRFVKERAALPAIALTTDTSALTALANDYAFEIVFARQIHALARPGDVVIALSTSGRSPNVVAAARAGRERGCKVVALTGAGGGPLGEAADLLVAVPSKDTARVQEVHELCLHAVVQEVEKSLFPDPSGETS